MTEQLRLAHALADESRTPAQIHRLLRWMGLRGFTIGFQAYVENLASLELAFEHLAIDYPNLAPAWGRMLFAREAHSRLARSEDGLRAGGSDMFPTHCRLGRPPDLQGSISKFPLAVNQPACAKFWSGRLLYASALTILRVWDGFAENLDARGRNAIALAEAFLQGDHATPDWSRLDSLAGADSNLETCLAHLRTCLKGADTDPSPLEDDDRPGIHRASDLNDYLDLLRRTKLVDYLPGLVAEPGGVSGRIEAARGEPETSTGDMHEPSAGPGIDRWGRKRSNDLLDRQLLPDSVYGLTDEQRRAVVSLLQTSDPMSTNRCARGDWEVANAAGFAVFAAVAASQNVPFAMACRVIRGDPTMPAELLRSLAETFLLLDDGRGANQHTTYWLPPRHVETGVQLVVDGQRARWPAHCVDFEIHELFALPPAVLVDRVRGHIALRLQRTIHQADLCLRHALARDMFAFNANRGVIDFVCGLPEGVRDRDDLREREGQEGNGDVPSMRVNRGALTSYLHPKSLCVTNAYAYAWSKLSGIGAHQVFEPQTCTDEQACMHIAACDMSRVVDRLRQVQQPDDNESNASELTRHRNFALYFACLFESATGHRASEFLLHFPHVIDAKEKTAFLADKLEVGSEARFVALPDLVLAMYEEYRREVKWLIDRTRPTNPSLAAEMAVAIGLRRPAGPRAREAVGALFTVRNGKLVRISSDSVDRALRRAATEAGVPDAASITTQALRRNLITFMANLGASGMLLEMQLGHNGDQHIFGDASNWVPLDRLAEARSYVDRYLAVNGWRFLEASWVPAGRPVSMPLMPSFARSDEAYEGRAHSHDAARMRVRRAIKAALDAEELDQDGAVLLDERGVKRIRRAIADRTRGDEDLSKLMSTKFDELLAQWNSGNAFAVDAAFVSGVLRQRASDGADPVVASDETPTTLVCRQIANVVTPERLDGEVLLVLDDKTVRRLRERIRQATHGDEPAQQKALSELAALADSWRRSGRYVVTASSVNLSRFQPGAMSVDFGRHLAIARHVVEATPGTLRDFLNRVHISAVDRLAVICILLVVTEAVLNSRELGPLLDAVQTMDLGEFEGQIQLRASVDGEQMRYDRTVDLTPKCAAAVLGFVRSRADGVICDLDEVMRAADQLVERIAGRDSGLNLERLCTVMRAYWFLRLPASLYAACVGVHEPSAPTESSMALLLGGAVPTLELAAPTQAGAAESGSDEIASATRATGKLLGAAAGLITERSANSRSQRMRLRRQLRSTIPAQLLEFSLRVPVVALWVSFVEYMLEVGGAREKKLRFNTIRNYQQRLVEETYRQGWSLDLLEENRAGIDSFYSSVISRLDARKRAGALTVLRLFHRFLRAWYGVGACSRFPSGGRKQLKVARSTLVPWSYLARATELAFELRGGLKKFGGSAAGLLALNAAHGLRTMEGFGARHADLIGKGDGPMRVRQNVARSVKTVGRVIPVNASSQALRHIVASRYRQTRARDGSNSDSWLFVDPTDFAKLISDRETVRIASWSLKAATGDGLAIPYLARHTFASSVYLKFVMPQARASAIASRMAAALEVPTAQFDDLLPTSKIYPFQIDRLGMWMGHSGVDMLCMSYSHVAWNAVGEYAARVAQETAWSDGVMASLLGIDRTVLVKRRKRLSVDIPPDQQQAALMGLLVFDRLVGVSLPSLLLEGRAIAGTPEGPDTRSHLGLDQADSLLLMRTDWGDSLPALAAGASDDLLVDCAEVARFFDGYIAVAEKSQMFDFEPGNSRLGLMEAHVRRRQLLATISERANSTETAEGTESAEAFLNRCRKVIDLWCERFDEKRPLIVVRTENELEDVVQWLTEVGYAREKLRLHSFSWDESSLDQLRALGHVVIPSPKRLERAARIGAAQELGVEIAGVRGLPANRDLARVLLAVGAFLTAGLSLK